MLTMVIFFFFSLYIDDLSAQLRSCNNGCMVGETLVSLLMYADDLVVLSPSSDGLQQLLVDTGSMYGVKHDIKYNASKITVFICRTNLISLC